MRISQAVLTSPKPDPADFAPLAAIQPQLVLVFGLVDLLRDHAVTLCQAFDGAHIAGCSTAGEISKAGVSDASLVVTALAFKKPASSRSAPCCRAWKIRMPPGAGWRRAWRPRACVPICGGLAGDGGAFAKTWVLDDMPGRKLAPILMITANDQKQVRHRALDLGANDFLTRPIDKVQFLARTRNMLSLNQARKHMADHASWLSGEVRKATKDIVNRERGTVLRLSKAAEYRDPETGAHIVRMAHYSMLIARELGLPEADQQLLLEAAPMHDIGKVGIADSVLLKPGRLTDDEFEVMKQHAMFGYDLLTGSISRLLQAGAEIAKGHHEKFDCTGYPLGIKGNDIPLFSRIVAVADVFDALTSERPYKKAWDVKQAVDFLKKGAGAHFDPACVQAFLNTWDGVAIIR